MITLASREFRVLTILPTSLRFLRILASSGSHGIATPNLLPNLTVYSREVPLLGFRFMWRSSGIRLRWQRSLRRLQRRFFCKPCAVLQLWRFFPQFCDFRASLGSSVLLRNFSFYSWATLLVLPFLLRLSILLFSLSPKVASLGCFSCRPPSLVVPVYVFGVSFCGCVAVSSSSPPAGCGVGSC